MITVNNSNAGLLVKSVINFTLLPKLYNNCFGKDSHLFLSIY